jgi:hypothetical protein
MTECLVFQNEVALLAWKPVVVVTTSLIYDAEGIATQVSVMPRSHWDEDPRFPEATREGIHTLISSANFSPDAQYVVIFDIKHSVPQINYLVTMVYAKGLLRAVEIVDALTSAATAPEDLAAAIAYLKDSLSSNRPFTDHFEHQAAAHGSSRALHNQLAYRMMDGMGLEFRVRLVGLRGATHLGGCHPRLQRDRYEPIFRSPGRRRQRSGRQG